MLALEDSLDSLELTTLRPRMTELGGGRGWFGGECINIILLVIRLVVCDLSCVFLLISGGRGVGGLRERGGVDLGGLRFRI